MFTNLTSIHLLLIIIGIIILIWLLNWFIIRRKNKQLTHQTNKIKQNNQLDFMIEKTSESINMGNSLNSTTQSQNSPFILYYFYLPTCPHCINFYPSWNELCDRISSIPGLTTIAIDSSKSENENLSFYYNVSNFPTIILVTPDKNIEYPGNLPRTVENIYTFVLSNIGHYQ